jgi:ParB family chromosome partitioning protein
MAKMGMLKNVQSRTGTQDSQSVSLTVKDIPVGDIVVHENIRREYTGIEELANSIRRHGLLQPITVYHNDGIFIVKTGHRRFMAYKRIYETEPERFHSIRCIVSDGENLSIVQLVENVQREDLSQIDFYNALLTLRKQGMTLKQIAEVIGKTEASVKRLFVGVNEIAKDSELKAVIGCAGATIGEVVDTKGIPDKEARLNLLGQRGKGEITRSEMRDRAKALKQKVSGDNTSSLEKSSPEKPVNETQSAEPEPTVKITVSDDGLVISLTFNNKVSAQAMVNEVRRLLGERGIREKGNSRIFVKKRVIVPKKR